MDQPNFTSTYLNIGIHSLLQKKSIPVVREYINGPFQFWNSFFIVIFYSSFYSCSRIHKCSTFFNANYPFYKIVRFKLIGFSISIASVIVVGYFIFRFNSQKWIVLSYFSCPSFSLIERLDASGITARLILSKACLNIFSYSSKVLKLVKVAAQIMTSKK